MNLLQHHSSSPLVAVTGATGRIGGAVAEQLRAGGPAPRLVVRDPSRAPEWADDVAVATYGDQRAATAALAGVDVLLMVSASESADRLLQHRTFIDAAAAAAEPLRTVVDINDAAFYAPGDMAARIDDAARATGQPRPRSAGEYVRCINDSLALAYRRAVRRAAELSGREVRVVHMVGGGVNNRLLCQLAADATGLPVLAGPAEGTALGNMVVAARGAGLIEGDLGDLRRLIRDSSRIARYTPEADAAAGWDAVEHRLFG